MTMKTNTVVLALSMNSVAADVNPLRPASGEVRADSRPLLRFKGSARETLRAYLSLTALALAIAASEPARAQAWGLPELSKETKACLDCHKIDNTGVYQQWGRSKHHRANVGCYECHMAKDGEPDAFQHEGQWIATIVSPKDCARCHTKETEEFAESHHSKAARILG